MKSLFDQTDRKKEVLASIKGYLAQMDGRMKLNLCRDLMIDQICSTIDKFPKQKQKEIIAKITDKYLSEWEQK